MKNGKSFVSTYSPKETVSYENLVKGQAMGAMGDKLLLSGPIKVSIVFCYPELKSWPNKKKKLIADGLQLPKITKPDIDNLVKAVCDGMNGIVYKDDSQVTKLSCQKIYWKKPQTVIHVEEYSNQMEGN